MTTFDPTKPVTTRDGRKARILATDRKHDRYPIVAIYETPSGSENLDSYTADGRYDVSGGTSELDLVNVPERTTRYLNVYQHLNPAKHSTLAEALISLSSGGTTVAVTFENGKLVNVEIVDA